MGVPTLPALVPAPSVPAPLPKPQASPEPDQPVWHPALRVLFRFAFAYLLLYNLFGGNLAPLSEGIWMPVVNRVGEFVFRIDVPAPEVTGSGDRTYDYVQAFCFLVLSALVAAAWSLLDRRRARYARMHDWFRVFLRVALGYWMINYGVAKLFQFPAPSPDRLVTPVGETSPMGLLWTFMGASQPYALITGAVEVAGGLLLIASRRTVLLGAVVCGGALVNIVLLNFCYDVPVKLFSTHLLVMAVVLALPELRRLANVFLFNRRNEPAELRPLFATFWLNRAALGLRIAFVSLISLQVVAAVGYTAVARPQEEKPPLYGVWNVEEFTIDGEVRPPLLTDSLRWRRVIVSRPGVISIQQMSDARTHYRAELNAETRSLELMMRTDPKWKSVVTYREVEPGVAEVEGTFDGRKVKAKLRRVDASEYRLVSRGFHWVNEYPFSY